jgi:hypothetical protein
MRGQGLVEQLSWDRLPSQRVDKLDQPLDLRDEKAGTAFVKLPEVVTVNDGVRQMRVPRTMGRPDTLPGICSINSHAIQSISAPT